MLKGAGNSGPQLGASSTALLEAFAVSLCALSPKSEGRARKKSEIRSPNRRTSEPLMRLSDFALRNSFGSRISEFGFTWFNYLRKCFERPSASKLP